MPAGLHLRHLLLLLPLALFTGACGSGETAGVGRVVLITCDTLRADRLGVYGYEHDVSPELDRFARECLVFENAFSVAPTTSPAVSAMLTGRLPEELGVKANKVQMPGEIVTVAEVLRDAGIPTSAVISNWVLSRRGTQDAGVQQGFVWFDDRMNDVEVNRRFMPERDAAATTDAALEWLDRRPDDRFFLWVHYQDPHGPYTPPDDCAAAVERPIGDGPELPVGARHTGLGAIPQYQVLGDERRPDYYAWRYDAEIRYFDRELGRLLDELEDQDLLDDALVLFTSDHGESLGERDYWFSHSQHLHAELVRVPFLVRYPEGTPRPASTWVDGFRRTNALVSHLDFPPTLLAAFGLEPLPGYGEGLLAPALDPEKIVPHTGGGSFGLSDGRYRLIYRDDRAELFDAASDPAETRDVAPREAARLRAMLERHQAAVSRLPHLAAEGVAVEETAADLQALDALGYTGED